MWKFDQQKLGNNKIGDSMSELFSKVHTGSVSLAENRTLSFTAYLAWCGKEIWLTSKASTEHVIALGEGPREAAVCLWQQPAEWGDPLFGLQLSGSIELVQEHEVAHRGLDILHQRFSGTCETLPSVDHVFGKNKITCLQRILITKGKIRDDLRLGKGMHTIFWEEE